MAAQAPHAAARSDTRAEAGAAGAAGAASAAAVASDAGNTVKVVFGTHGPKDLDLPRSELTLFKLRSHCKGIDTLECFQLTETFNGDSATRPRRPRSFLPMDDGHFVLGDDVSEVVLERNELFDEYEPLPELASIAELAITPGSIQYEVLFKGNANAAAEPTTSGEAAAAGGGAVAALTSLMSGLAASAKRWINTAVCTLGWRSLDELNEFKCASMLYQDAYEVPFIAIFTLDNAGQRYFTYHRAYSSWSYWLTWCGFGPLRVHALSMLLAVLRREHARMADESLWYADDIRSVVFHEMKCYCRMLSARTQLDAGLVTRRIAYLRSLIDGDKPLFTTERTRDLIERLARYLQAVVLPFVAGYVLIKVREEASYLAIQVYALLGQAKPDDALSANLLTNRIERCTDLELEAELGRPRPSFDEFNAPNVEVDGNRDLVAQRMRGALKDHVRELALLCVLLQRGEVLSEGRPVFLACGQKRACATGQVALLLANAIDGIARDAAANNPELQAAARSVVSNANLFNCAASALCDNVLALAAAEAAAYRAARLVPADVSSERFVRLDRFLNRWSDVVS